MSSSDTQLFAPATPAAASSAGHKNTTLSEIAAVLRDRQRFVVVSHLRPDGDALGCTLAMGLSLRALGKDVTLWNEDGMLDKLRFLPGAELVSTPTAQTQDFDVLVALDTATHPRLGTPLQSIGKVDLTINIDHHVSNPGYGDLAYIDADAPATGQILYELLAGENLPLDLAIATNLFAAISTDTGSFQYSQTTARTYEIAAKLAALGVNIGELSRLLYDNYPLRRLELLRSLLNTLKLTAERRAASFALSQHTARTLGVLPEDNEGLIDHLRAIDTVSGSRLLRGTAGRAGARFDAFQRRALRRERDLRLAMAAAATSWRRARGSGASWARWRRASWRTSTRRSC